MTKHQLRIGNKVKVFGKIYTIKELGEFEAAMEETQGVFVYSDVQGVELTGEVLEACGFEKQTGDYSKDSVVYSNGIRLYQHEDNEYSLYGYNERRVYISYVHELQNLFVLLMGTELTINIEQVKV